MSTRITRHSSRLTSSNNKKNYDSEDSIQSADSKLSLRRSSRRAAAHASNHDDGSDLINGSSRNKRASTTNSIASNKKRKVGKKKGIEEEFGSDNDFDMATPSSTVSTQKRKNNSKKNKKRSRMNSEAYDSSSTVYESSVMEDNKQGNPEDSINSSGTNTTDKKKNPFGKKKKEYIGDPPLNLNDCEKPFKNPNYTTPRKYKLLKQILLMDRNKTDIPIDAPLYSNIEAPPSVFPKKKYCDITGLKAIYTDPKTGLRYYDSTVYKYIQEQPQGTIQGYLGLRNAAVNLK